MTHFSSVHSPLPRMLSLLITAALTLALSVTFTLTTANKAAACLNTSNLPGTWSSNDARLRLLKVWVSNSCGLYLKAYSTCKHDTTKACAWDQGRSKELSPSKYVKGAQYTKYEWNNAREQLLLSRSYGHLTVRDHIAWKNGKVDDFTVQMSKKSP